MLQFEHPCGWLHFPVHRLLLQSHKLEITGTGEAVKLCFCHCTGVKKEEEGENVKDSVSKTNSVGEGFFSDIL